MSSLIDVLGLGEFVVGTDFGTKIAALKPPLAGTLGAAAHCTTRS
jgi:hypothetical protein